MNFRDLENIGLTEIEAKIYLAALELGETTIARIAKQAKIKRTTVYLHIDSLKQKGLIGATKKGRKVTFFAEDPRKLGEVLEERKSHLNRIMPDLLTFVKLFDKKPEIRFYEGMEGVYDVLRDVLRCPNSELLTWYSDDCFSIFEDDFFNTFYVPERKKRKIFARAIMQDSPKLREWASHDTAHLRRSKLLPANIFKIGISISVYGKNKINIISYAEKFGVIIESQVIYDSFTSIFETMWAATVPNSAK